MITGPVHVISAVVEAGAEVAGRHYSEEGWEKMVPLSFVGREATVSGRLQVVGWVLGWVWCIPTMVVSVPAGAVCQPVTFPGTLSVVLDTKPPQFLTLEEVSASEGRRPVKLSGIVVPAQGGMEFCVTGVASAAAGGVASNPTP